MPFINIHPAPGLGEMLPGWFVVPNNPFRPRAVTGMGKGVGMMLPASSPVPNNPLIDALRTVGMPQGKSASMGIINGAPVPLKGMGVLDSLNPGDWGWQDWLVAGGIGLLLLMSLRKGSRLEYKAAKLRAKSDYYAALAALKKKHPTIAGSYYRKYQRLPYANIPEGS